MNKKASEFRQEQARLFCVETVLDGATPENERDDEQNQEDKEQDLSNGRRCASDTAEAKYGSDDGNDEEDDRVSQHRVWLLVLGDCYPLWTAQVAAMRLVTNLTTVYIILHKYVTALIKH